jgi:hypothetical protein
MLAALGSRMGLIPHPTGETSERILLVEGPPDMIAARSRLDAPRMTPSSVKNKKSPAKRGFLGMEPAGIEPATSCLQRARDHQLTVGWRFRP